MSNRMAAEEWRQIVGFPKYEVSSHGRVRRVEPYDTTYVGKVLKPWDSNGYPKVGLRDGTGKEHKIHVHRLVTRTFHGPPEEGQEVNHIDGDCYNNRADNLEWVSSRENYRNTVERGTAAVGERGSSAKLKREQALAIRRYYFNTELIYRQIATRFGIAENTVGDIVRRETWKHIPRMPWEGKI